MQNVRLLTLTTGGTIGGYVAEDTDLTAAPAEPLNSLEGVLQQTLERLQHEFQKSIQIHQEEVACVDSSDIVPEHWKAICTRIHEEYDNYDGFVVTHGTNTMGYTCAALSFALENLGKPVVVTGSQVPFGWAGSDAKMNLENAVRVASQIASREIRGVLCVFGSHIITGARAKKATEFDYDAFQAVSSGTVGRIGRIIQIDKERLARHVRYLSARRPEAVRSAKLHVKSDFDTRLLSFTEFPGLSSSLLLDILKSAVERLELRGLVFRAFGAGDVSTHLHPVFHYLKSMKIPVVVTTQAPRGNSNFKVNEPGQALEAAELAIPAHDMSIEAITTKLSWLLGQGLGYDEIKIRMVEDLRGEISPSIE